MVSLENSHLSLKDRVAYSPKFVIVSNYGNPEEGLSICLPWVTEVQPEFRAPHQSRSVLGVDSGFLEYTNLSMLFSLHLFLVKILLFHTRSIICKSYN